MEDEHGMKRLLGAISVGTTAAGVCGVLGFMITFGLLRLVSEPGEGLEAFETVWFALVYGLMGGSVLGFVGGAIYSYRATRDRTDSRPVPTDPELPSDTPAP